MKTSFSFLPLLYTLFTPELYPYFLKGVCAYFLSMGKVWVSQITQTLASKFTSMGKVWVKSMGIRVVVIYNYPDYPNNFFLNYLNKLLVRIETT
jgi:hypothetical protein